MEPLFFIILSLIIGVATRHIFRSNPVPYTVVLLVIGLFLGLFARISLGTSLTNGQDGEIGLIWEQLLSVFFQSVRWAGNIEPHIIMFVFLPILIFEAAFSLDFHTFKKSVGNAGLLAVPGIVIAVFLTSLLIGGLGSAGFGFSEWSWLLAMVFGAVVSATDPVAVVAILKELGASKKLATLIEGESLLNDGTSIVVFFILIGILPFGLQLHTTGNTVFVEFLRVAVGGILLGVVIGGAVLLWVGKVFNDALIEITLIVVAAYLTFFIAEYFFHVSGVLGLVALGLSMASAGRTKISADVQKFLHEFWELAAFIANTLIFLIVGVVVAKRIVFSVNDFIALLILYIGLHIIRGIVFFAFYPLMRKVGYGLHRKNAIVAWYGGLRGAISLSLALLFVGEIEKISPKPSLSLIADQFLFYISGIVVLTLLINATTIKWLIKWLGLTKISTVKAMMFANAFEALRNNTFNELNVVKNDRFMKGADWDAVHKFLPNHKSIALPDNDKAITKPLYEARRRLLEKEKSSYWNQYKEGLLGSNAFTELTEQVNEIIDRSGTVPLNGRRLFNSVCHVPKVLSFLQHLPIVGYYTKKTIMNRLSSAYDVARGFVVSQDEVLKLSTSLDFKCNQADDCWQIKSITGEEIRSNRIAGLQVIKEIHTAYPEIAKAIETRQAARSILNFEKKNIFEMKSEGLIEKDEAIKLIADVEKRMKQLMDTLFVARLLQPLEVLKNVNWLQNVPDEFVKQVISIAQEKKYGAGQHIINTRINGEVDMEVIARGSVKVFINGSLIDFLGLGTVIGEMSMLTSIPRTADVVADTPVTTLLLPSTKMRQILAKSPVLQQNLWDTAGLRFAENILGQIAPFNEWSQFKLRKWLSKGRVKKAGVDETIRFHGQLGVLLKGSAMDKLSKKIYQPPNAIISTEVFFTEESLIFHSPHYGIELKS